MPNLNWLKITLSRATPTDPVTSIDAVTIRARRCAHSPAKPLKMMQQIAMLCGVFGIETVPRIDDEIDELQVVTARLNVNPGRNGLPVPAAPRRAVLDCMLPEVTIDRSGRRSPVSEDSPPVPPSILARSPISAQRFHGRRRRRGWQNFPEQCRRGATVFHPPSVAPIQRGLQVPGDWRSFLPLLFPPAVTYQPACAGRERWWSRVLGP
jgi:hypothetical protein